MAILSATPADPLAKILAAAQPGDAVQLAAGTYPTTGVQNLAKAAPGVIVEAAPGALVTIAGLGFSGCAGFTVRGLTLTEDPRTKFCVNVGGSERVVLDGLDVHGSVLGKDNGVVAVNLRNSRDMAVIGCDLHDARFGVQHLDCVGVRIAGNRVHDLYGQADGIRGASDGLDVADNEVRDIFASEGWHADAIQCWTTGRTQPVRGVHVLRNVIRMGKGAPLQGVFIGNEAGLPYEDLIVEGNAVIGALEHGICVSQAKDARIADNLVVGVEGVVNANGKAVVPWIMLRESTSGVVEGNRAPKYHHYLSSGFIDRDNVVIPMVKAGDESQYTAWTQRHADPRDVQIAELKADAERLTRLADEYLHRAENAEEGLAAQTAKLAQIAALARG